MTKLAIIIIITVLLKRFLVECGKAKSNQQLWAINNVKTQWTNQNSKHIHETGGERGKTRASKAKIGFSFISDCPKSDASYLTNHSV